MNPKAPKTLKRALADLRRPDDRRWRGLGFRWDVGYKGLRGLVGFRIIGVRPVSVVKRLLGGLGV